MHTNFINFLTRVCNKEDHPWFATIMIKKMTDRWRGNVYLNKFSLNSKIFKGYKVPYLCIHLFMKKKTLKLFIFIILYNLLNRYVEH